MQACFQNEEKKAIIIEKSSMQACFQNEEKKAIFYFVYQSLKHLVLLVR